MELRTLTAKHAFLWIKNGFQILKKKPGFFIKSALLYFLITSILSAFDDVTPLMLSFFLVTFTAVYFTTAIMLGSHVIFNSTEQELASITSLVSRSWRLAFQNKNIFILALITSIVYTVIYFGAYMVFSSIYEQSFTFYGLLTQESSQTPIPSEPHSISLSGFAIASAIEIITIIPIMILFGMTSALVLWRQASPAKAIFYNIYACFKNWKTWLCWGLIEVVFSIGLYLFLLNTDPRDTLPAGFVFLLAIILIIFLYMIMCLFSVCYYLAYKDSFVPEQEDNAEANSASVSLSQP